MNEEGSGGRTKKRKKKKRGQMSCCFGSGSDIDVNQKFDEINLTESNSLLLETSSKCDEDTKSTVSTMSHREQHLPDKSFEVDVSHLVNSEFDEVKGADSYLPSPCISSIKQATKAKIPPIYVSSQSEPVPIKSGSSQSQLIPIRSESNQSQPSKSSISQSSSASSPKGTWEAEVDNVLHRARHDPAEADFGKMMELVSHRLQGSMDPAFRKEIHTVLGHVGKIMSNEPVRKKANKVKNSKQRFRSHTTVHLSSHQPIQRRNLSLHEVDVQLEVKSEDSSAEGVVSDGIAKLAADEVIVQNSEADGATKLTVDEVIVQNSEAFESTKAIDVENTQAFQLPASDALENENTSASVVLDDTSGPGSLDVQRMIWLDRRSLHRRSRRWSKLAE